MKKILATFFIICSAAWTQAEQKQIVFENHIYEETIQTVLLYQKSTNYPVPVINVGVSEALELSFDELGTQNDYYQFTLVHCDAFWNPSRLQPLEYLQGNTFDNINTFSYSTNTYQKYVHYKVNVPSANLRPKFSGNYLLKVYRNFDESDLIITRRIFVLDTRASFKVDIHPATLADSRFSKQEVDFTAKVENYQIINPYQDIKVVISQNNRWDNAITNLKPQFIVGNEYSYNYERENLFDGTNEYRFFDFRSLRFFSQNVRQKYFENLNHLVLNTEEKRGYKKYFQYTDFNGKRVIANKDGVNGEIDGDYAYVYFSLASPQELNNDVYILGELTDWRKQDKFKMTYNPAQSQYEAKVLLKQGYYSYLYVTDNRDNEQLETIETEGNYFETENEYYLYFYCRNQQFDYDELIGFSNVKSRP